MTGAPAWQHPWTAGTLTKMVAGGGAVCTAAREHLAAIDAASGAGRWQQLSGGSSFTVSLDRRW